MESPFGIDHGYVEKAFNPIKTAKATTRRITGGNDPHKVPFTQKAKIKANDALTPLKRKG